MMLISISYNELLYGLSDKLVRGLPFDYYLILARPYIVLKEFLKVELSLERSVTLNLILTLRFYSLKVVCFILSHIYKKCI